MKKKYILILGIIIGMIISAGGVYAAEAIIESINVSYDNSNSGSKYTTVQESIDDLYEKSGLLKEKWVEKDLNGADPVLEVEGSTKKLIPVTIDNDGTVHYANLKTRWYDYSDKKWANAVILVDNPKNGKNDAEENYIYKAGDIINENDIESYFVWIPRYSYKIWNMANTEEYLRSIPSSELNESSYESSISQAFNKAEIIDIKFGNVSVNPKMTEISAKLGKYYTHPAFTLGDKDLNGIWVGKFETGYNQDGNNGNSLDNTLKWTKSGAEILNINSQRIIIKPNVFSWRNNTIKNFFLSSYNYDRTLESHMMKNTEWGAVAYLSQSLYGIEKNILINNNSNFITGYCASINSNQKLIPGTTGNTTGVTEPYNTVTGKLASTTGNITGIYDMSGGAWEYMASYVDGLTYNSGFDDDSELKTIYKNYVDIYDAKSNDTTYKNRFLGDATGELGPFYFYYDNDVKRYHNSWYANYGGFINSTNSWFIRGGLNSDANIGGIFYFGASNGSNGSRTSFRVVLSPSN